VTESVDVWAIGCLMHLLVSGVSIDTLELKKGKSPIANGIGLRISFQAMSLLRKMLVVDPE
jgi:hypothetical protein